MSNSSPSRRDPKTFGWSFTASIEAMATVAGIRFDRVFRDFDAIVESYLVGAPRLREMFGPDLGLGGPIWAMVSYGHVNCLGAEIIFPENSEVAHRPVYGSLTEGIRALSREMDFAREGLFPDYLVLWEKLKRAFPEQRIPFVNFKSEGPLTTAWLLRGHDFFTDIYDDPDGTKQFLGLVTDSVVKYHHLLARINGRPEVSPHGIFIPDDVAAMIPPTLWPELVVPYLEQFFSRVTTGPRHAHIEDLTWNHLKYLDELGLDSFDPSVSKKLTPALLQEHCQVRYSWRFNEAEFDADPSSEYVDQFILDAVRHDASAVSTDVWRNNCNLKSARIARDFVRSARKIEVLITQGIPRAQLTI
jgi:hypothetical protein